MLKTYLRTASRVTRNAELMRFQDHRTMEGRGRIECIVWSRYTSSAKRLPAMIYVHLNVTGLTSDTRTENGVNATMLTFSCQHVFYGDIDVFSLRQYKNASTKITYVYDIKVTVAQTASPLKTNCNVASPCCISVSL